MNTLAVLDVIDQGAIANSGKSFFDIVLESVRSETRSFLEKCKLIWEAKQLPLSEWNEIKQLLGWTGHTANPGIKVWQWVADLGINIYNLELLDIDTIKALCCDRYSEIWHQLQSTRMQVIEVRSQMTAINKALKKPIEPPKVLQWEQSKWGEFGNARLIIRLEDPDTGRELEKQFKESGKISVAAFLKELLHRPTVDEQVLAQKELDTYIEEHQAQLPADILAEIAKEDRITELTAQLRKVNGAIADLISEQYDKTSLPMMSAKETKAAIMRDLAMYGVQPIDRSKL